MGDLEPRTDARQYLGLPEPPLRQGAVEGEVFTLSRGAIAEPDHQVARIIGVGSDVTRAGQREIRREGLHQAEPKALSTSQRTPFLVSLGQNGSAVNLCRDRENLVADRLEQKEKQATDFEVAVGTLPAGYRLSTMDRALMDAGFHGPLRVRARGREVPEPKDTDFACSDLSSEAKYTEWMFKCLGLLIGGRQEDGALASQLFHLRPAIIFSPSFPEDFRSALSRINARLDSDCLSFLAGGVYTEPFLDTDYKKLYLQMVERVNYQVKEELGLTTWGLPPLSIGITHIYHFPLLDELYVVRSSNEDKGFKGRKLELFDCSEVGIISQTWD